DKCAFLPACARDASRDPVQGGRALVLASVLARRLRPARIIVRGHGRRPGRAIRRLGDAIRFTGSWFCLLARLVARLAVAALAGLSGRARCARGLARGATEPLRGWDPLWWGGAPPSRSAPRGSRRQRGSAA